jgi:hypothetical protein
METTVVNDLASFPRVVPSRRSLASFPCVVPIVPAGLPDKDEQALTEDPLAVSIIFFGR